jgi:hypothetical protein
MLFVVGRNPSSSEEKECHHGQDERDRYRKDGSAPDG